MNVIRKNTKKETSNDRFQRASRVAIRHYLEVAISKENRLGNLLAYGLTAIGSIFVFYIPPLAIAGIVGKVANNGSAELSSFIPYIMLFAGSWLVGEIMWRIGVHFNILVISRGVGTLYNNGLKELLRKDVGFFQDNFAGSLTKKTLGYANRYIDVTDTLLYDVFPSLIPAIFATIVLYFYSPLLALALILIVVSTMLLIIPLIKERQRLVNKREVASNIVSGHVADVYGNIEAVRSHASEKVELKRHSLHVTNYIKKLKRSWDFQNQRIDMIISPIYVMSNAVGLILSIHLALTGVIPFESIIVVFTYYGLVTQFFWRFNHIYRRIEAGLSDAAQFTELLLEEPLINEPSEPIRNSSRNGNIEFSDVIFGYEENDVKLFDKFNLSIKSGEKIGLVGRSGGGKTSITKLILRFSDVDSGEITIDGIAINKMTQSELRSHISYVPQDPAMFHRTISENIAYGKPNATHEEIIEAAKQAHAHQFITGLQNGYETLVGERGVKLSGGQRQRVAIARAILKDSPILLLDEATSALDSESEMLIQDALKKLMSSRTAIVIAHRLSTIQKLDRIIVMDKGKIAEEGSHADLIKRNGIYAKLWAHQSGGFIEE